MVSGPAKPGTLAARYSESDPVSKRSGAATSLVPLNATCRSILAMRVSRPARASVLIGEEAFERDRIGLQVWLLRRCIGKFAGLEKPAPARRQAPELRAAGVRQVPAHRRVVGVDRLVMAEEQLQPMAI